MKVPYSWLKEFVDVDLNAEELGEKLVSAGFEIEEYIYLRDNIKNVKVGFVDEIKKIENSDKLFLCDINIGEKTLQIVTGAQNVSKGDRVPVAIDGAVLPNGKVIHKGELRGIMSEGMLCSGEELGLTEDDYVGASVYGILILNKNEKIGEDINDVLGIDDVILDVAITANRPDCNSILGIAREVSAILNLPLKKPDLDYKENNEKISDYIEIVNKNPKLCQRYMSKVIKDVTLTISPKFIRDRLKAVGIRPINNLVDITNYILIEIGQPMHAFDMDKVCKNKIIIRNASNGEKIVALDGKEYSLNENNLAICDAEKPIAIAGVMGGEFSSICDDTQNVVLESARFARDNIRHTARDLVLHSDASARYEKGVDFYSQEIGLKRALHFFSKFNWGTIVGGTIDLTNNNDDNKILKYKVADIENILGTSIPSKTISDILNRLEIKTTIDSKNNCTSIIPAYREDIVGVNDLTEEVVRIYGYDTIQPILRGYACGGRNEKQSRIKKIKDILVGHGCFETVSYSFITPKAFDEMLIDNESDLRNAIKLRNPIGFDMSIMRTTLSYSMMKTIEYNVKHGNKNGRLFEISNTYLPKSSELKDLPEEKPKLVVGFYGEKENYYTLKTVFDTFFDVFDFQCEYKRVNIPYMHPGRTAELFINEKSIGYIGEVHPDCCNNFDLDCRVYIAEIDVDYLADNGKDVHIYKNISKYQGVQRDLALLSPLKTPASLIIDLIKKSANEWLENCEVFDVYTGGQIPKDKKSIAVSLFFRDLHRTLSDNEINEQMKSILECLSDREIILR